MSERISRGEVISLIAGIPAAIAVTTGAAGAYDPAGMHPGLARLGYVPRSPHANATCGNCKHYIAKGSHCGLVKDSFVQAGGWCKGWEAK